jgi:hypothetical protein
MFFTSLQHIGASVKRHFAVSMIRHCGRLAPAGPVARDVRADVVVGRSPQPPPAGNDALDRSPPEHVPVRKFGILPSRRIQNSHPTREGLRVISVPGHESPIRRGVGK